MKRLGLFLLVLLLLPLSILLNAVSAVVWARVREIGVVPGPWVNYFRLKPR